MNLPKNPKIFGYVIVSNRLILKNKYGDNIYLQS